MFAGRAFVYHLYPLTTEELGNAFTVSLNSLVRTVIFSLNTAGRAETEEEERSGFPPRPESE